MSKVYTKIVWDMTTLKIKEECHYEYFGEFSLFCGPSGGEKAIAGEQSALFSQLTAQSQAVFGAGSQVFNQLMGTFSPLVAAGPGQYGFSAAEDAAMRSAAITGIGQGVKNAQQVAAEQAAAKGGIIPSGAQAAQQAQIATAGGIATGQAETGITEAGYQQGRQNWATAVQGELGLPGVFSPATSAGSAASGAGQAAFGSQQQMAAQSDQWVGALGGVLGSLGGAAVKGLTAGVG
jgi:hypothetical protein